MIRPAVEAALEVARHGLLINPPERPPAGLRRFLSFSKLSPPALRAIAKVVESDDEFRAKVASSVDEGSVGRAGWLWLARPDGWEDEAAELEAAHDAAVSAEADERDERSARRKLASAQEAAERAAATARRHAEEVERLRAELAEVRSRDAGLEQELAELHNSTAVLQDERNRAVRELKDAEARLAERSAEHNRAKQRIRDLEAALASAEESSPAPRAAPAPVGEGAASARQPDFDGIAEALGVAVQGAETVAAALARLGKQLAKGQPGLASPMLRPGAPPLGDPRRGEPEARPAPDRDGDAGGARPTDAMAEVPRRTPLKLPGGVLDDTAEAAEHLVRSTGVLVLVDGYNVTMAGWPELPAAEQRAKLIRSLGELAARCCSNVEVIFDGADVELLNMTPPAPPDVRVRFSPADVEADDVLLDLLGQIPPARPVVVISSDNRVRDGATRLGANVVHARQLLSLLSP